MYSVRACTTLITINALILISLHHSAANHGVDFIVSIPGSDSPDTTVYMYITPYNTDSKVSLTWTLPNQPAQYGQAKIAGSDIQIVQLDFTSTPSVIRISATSPVVAVLTIVLGINQVYSMGSYLVSPTEELSSTYTVATHCGHESCNVIIANAGEAVVVTVTLSLTPDTSNITYNGKTYYNTEVIHLELGALEAVQIDSEAADLTGSTVASSRPIQVVAGGGLTLSSTTATNNNIMIEQMPTHGNLGTKFILINSISKRNVLTTVKVAFTQQNTRVSFQGSGLMRLFNESRWAIYMFGNELLAVLITDKPVIVEIIYDVVKESEIISLASVVVTPVDSWASRYVTLLSVGSIFLAATESCKSNILLNKKEINSTLWTQASNSPEYFCAAIIMTTYDIVQIVLEGQMGCTFGGYVVYENGNGHAAYPLGWKSLELESSLSSFSNSEETVEPNAMTYLSPQSESMEITVRSSESPHLPAVDAEITDSTKTLAIVSLTILLPSYFIASSEDILYSRLFVETVTAAVSTYVTHSPTASVFPASTSHTTESREVTQSTTSATNKTHALGHILAHCGNPCGGKNDGNIHRSEPATQHAVTSSSPRKGNFNPRNVSDTTASSINPTSSTRVDSQGLFNISKVYTLSPRPLMEETSSTPFLHSITAPTFIQFSTKSSNSSDRNLNTKVSIIDSRSETFEPSHLFLSEWIDISKTTQFTTDIIVGTETTVRMSASVPSTGSMATSKNTKADYNIKITTEKYAGNQTTETFNVTPGQCPCQCRSNYFLNLVATAPSLPVNMTDEDLLLDRKSLLAYRMSKMSLYNREQSAKYVGSTLGILFVVAIVGFLFSSDIFILCCKKSYTTGN